MDSVLNTDLWEKYRRQHIPDHPANAPVYQNAMPESAMDLFVGKDMSSVLVASFEGAPTAENGLDMIPPVSDMLIDDARFAEIYEQILAMQQQYPEEAAHLEAIARYIYQTFPITNTHTASENPPIPADNADYSMLRRIDPGTVPPAFLPILKILIAEYSGRDRYFLNMAMRVVGYVGSVVKQKQDQLTTAQR